MSDNNEFMIRLLALLEKQKSKTQINTDIKDLEKLVRKLKLTATLAKGTSKTELNQTIKQLESQLRQIKLQAKIDNRQLNREINNALRNVSARDINLNFNSNGERLTAQVRRAVAQAREVAERSPISVNIDLKREKPLNQLTAFTNKHTKINESSYWLGEAERLRTVISSVTNRDELRNATDQLQVFTSGVRATGYAAVSTTDRIKGMLGNIIKVGNYFGLAFVAVNKFRQSLNTLKTNDTILTEISKTSEMTKQQLKELGDEAFKVASKYGQVSGNYLTAVQEMARSGYEMLSKELAELSLLAQSAGDMTADSANNYLLATDAAYKYSGSVEKLNAALDGANYISNKNSANLTDIADATRVSASFAANAGVAIDELTAAEATMIAVTKRSGSEIGRAFRSIVLNLQQVSGEFDGEVIDEEQLKKVEDRCHSLGVELEYMKDGVPTLRNTMDVLRDLAKVYNSLPDNSAEKQGLISDIGGKYHANSLSALLSRWDMYEKMLGEFSQGTGSALEEANKTADSWEGRLAQLQNSWDSFVNTLTNKAAVKGGVSFLDNTIQAFEKLTETVGALPVLLTSINASMSALNKNYGITQIYNKSTHKIDLQGSFMGFDITAYKTQANHFREAESAIRGWNTELANGVTDITSFGNATVRNNEQLRAYLQTTSVDAPASLNGYRSYLNATGQSTDALRLKTVLMTSAMSIGFSFALQAVFQLIQAGVTVIDDWIHRVEKANEAMDEAITEYDSAKSSLESINSELEEQNKKMDELLAKDKLTDSILGNMKISDIRKINITYFYEQLQEKGISYGTVSFYHKLLSSVFNMAVDNELIRNNPTKRALEVVEGTHQKREALTRKQQEVLLTYLYKHDRDMYRKVAFLIGTMCRVSEFAGLTWEDIDMKNRIIVIDHQLQYKKIGGDNFDFHITSTKNTHTRKIPITDDVYDVLSELHKYFFILRKDYCVDGKKDFLFYSKSGKLLNITSFNYDLKRAVEKYNETAEYKIDRISAHTLRHTGCTRDAEDGMDIKVLQYIMGHSNTQITNNVYNHVNEERAASEVGNVAERRRNRA